MTATAAHIGANGPASVGAGPVHGYSVAFAVGVDLQVLAALAAAILVRDRPTASETTPGDPAFAVG